MIGDEGGDSFDSADMALGQRSTQYPNDASKADPSVTQRIVESIPVGVYSFSFSDADGSMSFEFISDHACSLLGVDKEALLKDAMVAFSAAHPEDREALLQTNISLFETASFHFEGRFIVKGEIRWLRLQSNRVSVTDQGSQWDGIITDITEEKMNASASNRKAREIEQELRKRENALEMTGERLKNALQISGIGIWDWNIRKNALFFAPEGLFPKEKVSSLGSDFLTYWRTFIHPDDQAKVMESFGYQSLVGDEWTLEFRLQTDEGTYRWKSMRVRVLEWSDQKAPERLIGTLIDYEDRKKADMEIKSLVAIIEASSDLIAIANFEGEVSYLNLAGRNFLGFSSEEPLMNYHIKDAHPDWAMERVLKEALPIALSEGSWHGDNVFIKRDGTLIDFSQLILCPRDPFTGEALFLATVCRNVSDRKRLEAELTATISKLEDSDRRKNDFLSTLAHELRNPLAPIGVAVELLKIEGISREKYEWCLDVISRQTTQLTKLIDDLLDVSRINRGLISLNRKRIDLSALLPQGIKTLSLKVAEQGRRLTLRPFDGSVCISGDEVRIEQILGNLVSNAVKFSPRDTEIIVSATWDRTFVSISVKDQGIGIAPEHQAEIFGLFSQLKHLPSPSNDGLGIGLFLVRHLIELHGGQIKVQSDGIGRGSEFIFQLPILHDEIAPSDEADTQNTRFDTDLSVLVVDDNLDAQDALALYFELKGNEVHRASDGLEAVELAEAQRPQLIILDIGLPGLDGYNVCRKIREQPWGQQVVILALSGWGSQEDKNRALATGFDEHFTKPLDFGALRAFLEKHKAKVS